MIRIALTKIVRSVEKVAPNIVYGAILFSLLLSGGELYGDTLCSDPGWWHDQIKENSDNYFFAATGRSTVSHDEAKSTATEEALKQAAQRLGSIDEKLQGRDMYRTARTLMRGWHYQGSPDHCFDGQNYQVWLIVRYPKDEFAHLTSLVLRPEQLLAKAYESMASKAWQKALQEARTLIREYPLGGQNLFATEKAMLLAAECLEKLGRIQEAKNEFTKILDLSDNLQFKKTARVGYNRTRGQLAGSVETTKTGPNSDKVVALLAAKEFSAALQMAEKLIELQGESVATVSLLARSHQGLGNAAEALALYESIAASATPAQFRLLRTRMQKAEAERIGERIIAAVDDASPTSWSLAWSPQALADGELQSFVRLVQGVLLRLDTGNRYRDWLLVGEVLGAQTPQQWSEVLAEPDKLWTIAGEVGVDPVDLVVTVSPVDSADPSLSSLAVDLLHISGIRQRLVTGSVRIARPTVDNVASIGAGRRALDQGDIRKAGRIFNEIGSLEYGKLFEEVADLVEAGTVIVDRGKVDEELYTRFALSLGRLKQNTLLWIASEDEQQLAGQARKGVQTVLSRLESHYPRLGGDTRSLLALLNDCREVDVAMGLDALAVRHPEAIERYSQYAEKYRQSPSWSIADTVWIDTVTGYPLVVRDKVFDSRFVFVAPGRCFFGNPKDGKQGMASMFFMQENETTNREFLRFCEETGWQRPVHLIRREEPASGDDFPVTRISYVDALNYAKWFSRRLKPHMDGKEWRWRLPTELEWERAARLEYAIDSHLGATPGDTRRGEPVPVGQLAGDQALSGVRGMAGNVSEWCLDGWTEAYAKSITPQQVDLVNQQSWDQRKVAKGGTYYSQRHEDLLITARRALEPGNREPWLGFRLVVVAHKRRGK